MLIAFKLIQMNKVVALGLFIIFVSALQIEDSHQQVRTASQPTQPTQTNGPVIYKQNGYESVAGAPYG